MVAVKSEITVQDAVEFEGWLKSIEAGRTKSEIDFIRRACGVAQQAHQGQTRASGEPYFQHSLAVANILADLHLDYETIAAAVLHDVPEDTFVTLAEIQAEFGQTVAKLVDGVTKMGQIQEYRGQSPKSKKERARAESLRKMLLAMVEDVRVVLIKLADRTHNMRTLASLPEEKRKRIAKETIEIFAPLANRLGIWQIKWELEDLAFRYLEPDIYKQIAHLVDERRINREQYIIKVAEKLKNELQARGITAEVSGRPKHIYSIWRKMKRKGVDFDQIYDVQAVRVLVNELSDCYAALGIVHTLWRPIPGEFDDYIAMPKDNHYRSLHTAVIGPDGKTVEVQIRTGKMHQDAEWGVAAHWRYKEGSKSDMSFDRKIASLRQAIIEWKDDVADAAEFLDQVKTDFFQDRVHVLTPHGDPVDLPAGATPVDFAYHIHTEIGHRCRGAKVNGRIVPLSYKLRNGEQVEILTAKRGGPSRDWLNSQLGYMTTSRARAKVRQWFKRQNYEEHVAQGRAILDRELHRLGVTELNHEKLAREFNFHKVDDFLATIGRGDISIPQIISVINDIVESDKPVEDDIPAIITSPSTATTIPTGIKIQGVGNMLTNLAQCCRPVPGDDAIIGFVTRGRGVTIHRRDCPNILGFNDEGRARLIEVDWDMRGDDTYPVDIEIDAFDRPGLLRDITAVLANEKINISSVSVITRKKEMKAKILATLDIANLDQLGRVLNLIAQVPNIVEVRRRRQ
ncbi:MAG: GTP diphosphokinase [Anaerolineae bacterium]